MQNEISEYLRMNVFKNIYRLSIVNTSNHWCMKKWRSRPTFTSANLSDFLIRWKRMFVLSFRRSSDFWKREYLYNVTFWKRALVTELENGGWSSCCWVISSPFQKFLSQPPIMSPLIPINGCCIKYESFCQWSSQHCR